MRGIATAMKRSRNSHMRAPRSVTAAPISWPSRSPKFAIDFFARFFTGCCPVIVASSSPMASSSRGCLVRPPLVHDAIEQPRLLDRLAESDVDHDLLDGWDLVRVREAELLLQLPAHG